MAPPSGTVTFLFTDIEGSTVSWESARDAMSAALARHDKILRSAVEGRGGYVFSTGGDGFAVAFPRAGDAVAAAVEVQRALEDDGAPQGFPVRVRMGLHTGVAEERDQNYFGPDVIRAARIMAAGHGGQILCSSATAELVEGHELLDLGEHRLPGLSAPLRVFQVGTGRFPPLLSLSVASTNLPIAATEVLGRDDDITELAGRVHTGRLVTLVGTGGVGKTRLALAVAARVAPEFPDGCWLVELSTVSSNDQVGRAVAEAVGVTTVDESGLARYLGQRRTLVVLDNCEHVLDAVGSLAQRILAAGPDPVLMVTSRALLGIGGEEAFPVRPLGLPAPGEDAARALASDAVRLFVARATAVAGRFQLDDSNVADVVEICRHLDGVPLAIEIAAARARAVSPTTIAASLGERFKWSLRPGDRQRTLEATVSWSYGLLTSEEQLVFRRLAVFPASFGLAAAVAVAGGDGADPTESLVRLVDCSMVVFDPDEGRYRLLETLRQYGEARLVETGEVEAACERHAHHFLALAERLAPQTMDERSTSAYQELAAELDNLRATAEWCERAHNVGELARMALGLRHFLYAVAPADGMRWYASAVADPGRLDAQGHVDILGEMAWAMATHFGDQPAGFALADRSNAVARREGLAEAPRSCLTLALASRGAGEFPAFLAASEHARSVTQLRGDELTAVVAISFVGEACGVLGDMARSAHLCHEALDLAESTGQRDVIQAAVVEAVLPHFALTPPDAPTALAILEAAPQVPRVEDAMAAWTDVVWGAALVLLGRRDAVHHLARSIRLADRLDLRAAYDEALPLLAIAAARAGRQREAAVLIGYRDAHRANRVSDVLFWLAPTIEDVLQSTPDSATHTAAGGKLTRSEVIALVNQVELDADGI